jgi:hypothetical protein
VGFLDASQIVAALLSPVGAPNYNAFANFDGDGGIGFIDASLFVPRLFSQLPTADPVGGFPARPDRQNREPLAQSSEIDAVFAALDDDEVLDAFVA